MNIFEDDVTDFFTVLHKHQVSFILVGGLAVNYYGYTRATGDIDLWIKDDAANREKLVSVLKEMEIEGAEAMRTMPLVAGFSEILLGHGVHIDLMSELQFFSAANFDECYELAETFALEENCNVKVLHINKLIEEKERSKRLKDQDDAAELKKIREIRSRR